MKRKLRNILFLSSLVFFVGCDIIKEKQTVFEAKLINKSGVEIEIQPFQYGVAVNDLKIEIKDGDSMIIGEGFFRGIVKNVGFYSSYLSGPDSLHVIFNDSFLIVHYITLPEPKSNPYYPYDSKRNLFNYLSYEYRYKDKSKYAREAFYRDVFTEQDYLDAKN